MGDSSAPQQRRFSLQNAGDNLEEIVTSESTNSSNNTVIVTKCGAEPSDIIGDNYFLKQFHLFSDLCIMDVRVS